MDVYIDDMLVKSLNADDHLKHLQETFDILRKHNVKLSLEKCAFRVGSDKLLAFLVSQRGIEVNPDKIKAIKDIPGQLTSVKDVQRLTERFAAVRSGLESSSTVSEVAVSAILVREDEGAETHYPHLEKLALALVVASRKLKPNLQCYPIVVVTNFPLRNVLHKPELSGRLAKWAIEISEFDIEYKPRTAMKSQVLANFVADFSPKVRARGGFNHALGGNPESGLKMVPLTNNEAEYEALVKGLELARGLGSEVIEIKCDSQLVVNQVEWSITHIPREENVEANALANLRNEFIEYLRHGKLPEDPKVSRALRTKAAHYCLMDGQLYKRSYQGQLARCLGASEADYVMGGIHEETCGNQPNADLLVLKLVKEVLRWGMDIVVPLPPGPGKAYMRMVAQKQRMERYYNRRANLRYFKVGDLVLRKVTQSTQEANTGKLGPT
nr:uncharacterized protein LOC104100622 [Nicotiana tomentosiformis]